MLEKCKLDGRSSGFGVPYRFYVGIKTELLDFIEQNRTLHSLGEDLGVHLNPARAGLIRVGEERLGRYRWSSYPWYVKAGEGRPAWFVTEPVLGNLGLPPQERKGYEAYIEGRVLELGLKRGRKELAEE